MTPSAPEPLAQLAIETAFPSISVALRHEGRVMLPAIDLSAKRASALHGAIEDLFDQARVGPGDIDCIVVDVGPGSYTGLRVGLALVRTYARLVPLTLRTLFSTDQLAFRAHGCVPEGEEFAVCLDARRRQWFYGRYVWRGHELARLSDPACLTTEALRAAAGAIAHVVTADDVPPLDAAVDRLGPPAATTLFDLDSLAATDADPRPVYLMPPV